MDFLELRIIINFLSGVINLGFATFIWSRGKSKTSFWLGLFALVSAAYAFAYTGIGIFESIFWNKAAWIGTSIAPTYIIFTYFFLEKTKNIRLKCFFWYSIPLIILFLSLTTPYMVAKTDPHKPYMPHGGPLASFGRIFVIISIAAILFYFIKRYLKTRGIEKIKLKYILFGTLIYAMGGVAVAGILPLFYPEFQYVDVSVPLSAVWVGLTTYAIFKQNLFKIKIVLIEILVTLIGLILFIQALLFPTILGKLFGFIIFITFLFIGYLLIKSTQKEVKRKEEAEKLAQELKELNKTLENRVEERTKELQQKVDDLEKFHKLTVGREIKMLELKKKIKELEERLKNQGN